MTKKSLLLIFGFAVLSLAIFAVWITSTLSSKEELLYSKNNILWEVQSIDTVKYSRDLARQMRDNASFDKTIETQIADIASTGATHVALGTPYDEEFTAFLARWVSMARKYDLNVWFRGNFSGWEGWFDYKSIGREEHIRLTQKFILDNGDLFEDGDVFSACTECENGGPGDPRRNGDVEGHRQFLIDEYKVTNEAFRNIGKNVRSNFAPMNADVAKLVMDRQTTKALGGIVVIDHYVRDPKQLSKDVEVIAQNSGGKVVLGEFGAPIVDIHGQMTENQQAGWIKDVLGQLSEVPKLVGVNYWVSRGGATELWEDSGKARTAVSVIEKYFKPEVIGGKVSNEIGMPIVGASVSVGNKSFVTKKDGNFSLAYVSDKAVLTITADSYNDAKFDDFSADKKADIVLVKKDENVLFRIYKFFYRIGI